MDNIEQKLNEGYALALARWQVEIYQARNGRLQKRIQRYFNSTPVRNAMARLMFVAAHDKLVYTKAVISRELYITRQAASKMVEECLEEHWVEADGKGYKAAPALIAQMYEYTEFHVKSVSSKPLRYWLNAMENYQMALARSLTEITSEC